jgi:hypothetical protein
MATTNPQQIFKYKATFLGLLEVRRFPFLGWSNESEYDFLQFGTFIIKNGSQIRFWEDIWLGTSSPRDQYSCLYHIARHKQVTVADVFSTSPLNLSWRRDLIGPKLVVWNELLPRLGSVVLSDEQDGFRWNLAPNRQFSMKSHYLALIHLDVPNLNKRLWKLKAHLKVKIFL